MTDNYKCECGETMLLVGDYCRECPVCGASDGPFDNPNKPVDNPYLRRESPPIGHWTKKPPTEPGWYWAIDDEDNDIEIVTIHQQDFIDIQASQIFDYYSHWWSEPLKPPPRCQRRSDGKMRNMRVRATHSTHRSF